MDMFLDSNDYKSQQKASSTASKARDIAERLEHRTKDLERRVNKIALACQALWELLREQTELEEEDVYKRMEEIDMRDGKKDGKIGSQILVCTTCGKNVNSSRPVCVYCGTETKSPHIVE